MLTRTTRLTKPHAASFLRDTFILAIAAVIAKVLGAVYRIPLTNILGAEGIGLYQLVFPIYALFITLSSGAIPAALARIISSRTGDKGEESILLVERAANKSMLVLGCVAAIILCAIAYPISLVQGNTNLQYCYYIIAPAIIIVALSNCIKGYFQGRLKMLPTAISQVVEQSVKLIIGLLLAWLLVRKSVLLAVLASIFSVLLSEIVALCVLSVQYYRQKTSRTHGKIAIPKGYYRIILYVTLPLLIGSLFFPLTQFIDSLLIVNILKLKGLEVATATAQYGLLTGSVMTLINMPIVVILSVATAILPYVSQKRAMRNCPSIVASANKALVNINRLALPCAIAIFLLSPYIISVLYPRLGAEWQHLASGLMQIAALNVLLIPNMQLFASLLQGLGHGKAVAYNMGIACIIKIGLDCLMIYYIGIEGALWAGIISYAIILIANIIEYTRLLGRHFAIVELLADAISAMIMGLAIYLFKPYTPAGIWGLMILGFVGVVIYLTLVIHRYFAAQHATCRDFIPLYLTHKSRK